MKDQTHDYKLTNVPALKCMSVVSETPDDIHNILTSVTLLNLL